MPAPRVALFVPCVVDQLAPQVGLACLELLEGLGVEVDFPPAQTCCGQPFLTAGEPERARRLARRCVGVFRGYAHVVAPSGSCVAMLRLHYPGLLGDAAGDLPARSLELCEFLTGVLGVTSLPGRFPHRVGLHPSCHALRGLRLGAASERMQARPDPVRALLGSLEGIELVAPSRPDECCGFGGSFALDEAEVSCAMGRDRLRAHRDAGAEVIASTDVSCLLHLDGLARREGLPLRLLHVAEILAQGVRDARGGP
jgi:L-lactate dehydrogenase complex protein LldE